MNDEDFFKAVNLIAKLQRKYGRRLQMVFPAVPGQVEPMVVVYRNGDGSDHTVQYVLKDGEAVKVDA